MSKLQERFSAACKQPTQPVARGVCEGDDNCARDAEFDARVDYGRVRLCARCRDAAQANGILRESHPINATPPAEGLPPQIDLSHFLIIEPHADGSVYIVNPDPLLRDPVNGMDAVIAKCGSVEEARKEARRLTANAASRRTPEDEALSDFLREVADEGCLRGRQVHCAERESNSADWCVACKAKFLFLSGGNNDNSNQSTSRTDTISADQEI